MWRPPPPKLRSLVLLLIEVLKATRKGHQKVSKRNWGAPHLYGKGGVHWLFSPLPGSQSLLVIHCDQVQRQTQSQTNNAGLLYQKAFSMYFACFTETQSKSINSFLWKPVVPFLTVFKNKYIISVLLLSERARLPWSPVWSCHEQAKERFLCVSILTKWLWDHKWF